MAHEEIHVISALIDLCKEYDVKCLIQVGAEDAWESYNIGQAIPLCRIIAIEADPGCNPIFPNINYHRELIGDNNEFVQFHCYGSGLSSKIKRGEGAEVLIGYQHRLDTFCEYFRTSPDALIIDTEGTTLEVLRGCGALLDKLKFIYAECQTVSVIDGDSPVDDVDALLREHGMVQRDGLPSYNVGIQGNYTWVRRNGPDAR